MAAWLQRFYRASVAALLTAAVIVFGPSPEVPITVWTAIWIYLVCVLWAGFAGRILARGWQLAAAQTGRGDVALSLVIMVLGFTLVVFFWVSLAEFIGFWGSVFAMVPVFGVYALIDWIVRHRDDFDTGLRR